MSEMEVPGRGEIEETAAPVEAPVEVTAEVAAEAPAEAAAEVVEDLPVESAEGGGPTG